MRKYILTILIIFVLNASYALANDNFLNKDWWKNATVEDVKKEIDSGANVNAIGTHGATPMMYASMYSNDPKVIQTLVDAGVNINASYRAMTALMYAAEFNNNHEIINAIIKAGADVNRIGGNHWNALIFAATYNKNPEIVKTLISAGSDIHLIGVFGSNALISAAGKNSNPKIIKALIEAGANLSDRNEFGETAFLVAAKWNENLEVIKTLITLGSDVEAINYNGLNASTLAEENNKNREVANFLVLYNKFDKVFMECHSIQNIGKYTNKFCKCAIETAINELDEEDKQKAQEAFEKARLGTFDTLIRKGKLKAFEECY